MLTGSHRRRVDADNPGPTGPEATGGSLIDEIVRDGARRMLAAALEAEVAAYIAAHTDQLDTDGWRLVVRDGHAVPRQVLTSSGAVEVAAPRVNDKRVDAVTAIEQMTEIIARISEFQTTIASAVEEQTATTSEVTRNVSDAAMGAKDISDKCQQRRPGHTKPPRPR